MLAADFSGSTKQTEYDFQFMADEQQIRLLESSNRIAIAFEPGASVVLPETFTKVRDVVPNVSIFELSGLEHSGGWTIDALEAIQSITGVDYTASVLVNLESNSEAVLLNEIIVALEPGVEAEIFFAQNIKFSGYRRLDGTPDQFIATVRDVYGSDALRVGLEIESAPGVAWMSPNFYQNWERFYTPNDPRFTNLWHLHNVGQGGGRIDADSDLPEAWDINPGGSSNIVISVIDDGVQSNHPDLDIWTNPGEIAGDGIDNDGNGWIDDMHGWNFVFDTNNSAPLGTDAHGTAVAGVAAARGDNTLGVTGAAYRSKVISLKMFDGNFVASDANIAAALYYAAGRNRSGVGTWKAGDLVNNSWGGGGNSLAINNALVWGTTLGRQGRGATYLFATGNGFSPSVSQPAVQSLAIPGVIAVGASNNFDERSDYSNWGTAVDLVAPSNDTRAGYLAIDTTDRTGGDGYAAGDYTGTGATGFGGTSSATPLASGIAALVLAQADLLAVELNPTQVRAYLRNATDFMPGFAHDLNTGKNFEVGYGRLNARTAVEGIGKAEISVVSTTREYQSGNNLNFGSVNLGRSLPITLRIRNQGTSTLNLSSLMVTGPFAIETPVVDDVLEIGEATTFTVSFLPIVSGASTGELTIFSNDIDESSFVLNLLGNGLPTALSGRLYEDFDGDGAFGTGDRVIDAGGIGFAYLDANNSGTFNPGERRAFADASGIFEFQTLPIGSYTVRTVLPGWTATGPTGGSYSFQINSPDDFNIGRNFGYQKHQRLYGRVFNDADLSGVMEPGEFGVQSQIVHLDLNQNSRFDGSNLVNSRFDMVPILDLGTSTSTISFVSAEAVSKVRVTINVQHTWNEDLDIALISPTGVRVWLVQDRGGDTNGFSGTVFDDDATVPISNGSFPFSGVFRPETPLAALNGGPANGTWTLEIFDDTNFDDGNLLSWSLEIDTIEPHQFANELGFVGLDLNAGSNVARLEPVGIWDYSTPSDGVHTLVANPAAPTSSIFYGIFFENFAPTVLTLAGNSVFENRPPATLVGRLSTTDPNSRDSFSYSLVDGPGAVDNGMFEIVGSQLTTAVSFNFEDSPIRMVRIRTTDSGGLSIEREFTISIRDVNEPPTGFTLSSSTIQENSIAPYFVGSIVVDDPDIGDQGTHFFRFNSSTQFPDNNLFEIRGNELYTRATFSFESRGVYVLSVRAIDSMDAFVDAIVPITITDVNEAPTSIDATSASFLESLPVASVVTRLVAADPDVGDTISFSLVSGVGSDDNAEFLVSGNQLLSRNAFDFETKSSYRVRVRATDASGLWTETPFTFTVQNVNEMPNTLNLSSTSVNEGLAIGSRVGNFSALDPDAISTFTFATKMSPAFPDNDAFSIVGNELRTKQIFRFAQRNSYSILVQVTDQGGLSIDRVFTINVLDVNDSPTDVGLSVQEISESAANDSLVGQLSTVDADAGDSFVYSFVAGAGSADNASFRITGNQLRTNSLLNFEAKSSYAIRIESRDAAGATFERSFVIQVLNENEAPTAVGLSALTIRENNSPNASIGSLSSIDPDTAQSFTYSLVNGTGDRDNSIFVIAGTTLRTTVAFDFEAKPDYQVRIRTTDGGGLSFELPFVISVQNANESPFGLQLLGSLTENAPLNSVALNAVASDPDANEQLTFSLISGIGSDDNGKFTISANGGLSPVAAVNFESQSSYSIRVRVVDRGGIAIERALTIAVVNQNEAPTNVILSKTDIDENQSPNAVVGLFTVVDQDVADSSSFSLVSGAGDTDNNLFVVSGNTLQATSSFDFETKNTYSLRVRATDVGGLSFEKTIVVSVKDVNEQPFAVNLTSSTLLENAAIGSAIGDLRTIDVDAQDRFSYSLVAGAGDSDNGQFVLDGATLRSNSIFDFESRETYTVRIRTQDQGGLSVESPLTISIRDINDLPTNLQIQSSLINENSPVGTLIGAFTASDQDAGDVISYRFAAGNNDNSLFSIVNGQLTSNTSLNFESRSSYQVAVQAFDLSGSGPTQTFTITVRDVNETPSNIALDTSSINENLAAGTVVGRLSATDPDANDQFTFTLVSGEGSSGNSSVTINGTQLVLASALNFESNPILSVRVRATDAAFNSFEKALNVSVVDLPEAPTEVRLSSASISENLPAGTVVGTLSTIDPDVGGSFTYQIVAGQSSLPFAIVGNQLRTTRKLNFEALATYTVSIRSTDASSLSVVSPLLISVLDVNEQAIITGSDSATTPTNRTVVIDVLANDRDPDGTIDRNTVVIVAPPTRGSVRVLVDGRLEYTPPENERLEVSFSYQVMDNDQVLSNVGLVAVRVLSAYQNPNNRLDVDNDGDVSPLDVLQIINDIEANKFRDLPTNVGETIPYIDTNGNSKVDPLDVLDVINFLNRGAGESAEGEQSRDAADLESQKLEPVFGESMQAAHAMAIDAFYRELEVKRGRSRS